MCIRDRGTATPVGTDTPVGTAAPGGEPADWRVGAWAFAAGLALTSAELTRPYFIYLLPVLLILACLALRPSGRRSVALFLLPVILLSGSWHFHIARTQGQLAWTNHSGFNLQRGWSMVTPPPLVEEVGNTPLAPGRWINLNTAEHSENSRRLTAAVVDYIRANPVPAMRHVIYRLREFMSMKTATYEFQPTQPGLIIYRIAGWLGFLWLAAQSVRAVVALFRRQWAAFLTPESQLIAIAAASILVLSLGEAYEEARLVVTVLPLLAALPIFGQDPHRA